MAAAASSSSAASQLSTIFFQPALLFSLPPQSSIYASESSSSSTSSLPFSTSQQQPSSLAYPEYDESDSSASLSGEDGLFYLPPDPLALPLSLEQFASQIPALPTIDVPTTAPTSTWLDYVDLGQHASNQDGLSSSSSLSLPAGTGSLMETGSIPFSDVPISVPDYDALFSYSNGDEIEVDSLIQCMNAQDSFEAPTAPDTQFHNQNYAYAPPPQQNNIPTTQSSTRALQPKPISTTTTTTTTASSPTSSNHTNHSSPSSSGGASHPHPQPKSTTQASSTPAAETDRAADKRRRNTLAARRFRQKQQDRVAQLEKALESVSRERDALKMQVARWEGEAVALRGMLKKKEG
ncbi:hypothetical protein FQN52_003866 [Onygenales sp. PD_12]|nr:hypothetical protein FQN52_003866 [Onygenales sp. PD_12]